jgi:hypothetical protein
VKADAFATMLQTALNHGALSLMMSIRHRTGLFDTMDALPPSTSAEIASAANLNERYVREWLAAMVTARVVELHPETSRYVLPPEHAAVLTRAAGPHNMTVVSQFFAGLGSVEDEIVQCFRKGGGVPYSRFPRFHEVMAEDSNQSVLSSLEGHVLPLVPGLTDALKRGIRVLDVGCGCRTSTAPAVCMRTSSTPSARCSTRSRACTDSVAGPGRRRARRHVGGGEGARVSAGRGVFPRSRRIASPTMS